MSFAEPDYPIGATALMAAYARAQETRRSGALFNDPWAELFVRAALGLPPISSVAELPSIGAAQPDDSSEVWNYMRAFFVGRTPFFDDQVLEGVRAGAEQVVSLAAGLDARSARLRLPEDVLVYEVDTADVLDFKDDVLGRAEADVPRRIGVPADLASDWIGPLISAGFQTERRTVWVLEGILMYLDARSCHHLLEDITAVSFPGSRLAVEYFAQIDGRNDVQFANDDEKALMGRLDQLVGSGPSETPETWFSRFAITLAEQRDLADELKLMGRPVPAMLDPEVRNTPVAECLAAGLIT